MNLTRILEDGGSIPGLTRWVKDLVLPVSCGAGRRHGLDLALWLWLWLAAVALTDTWPGLGTSICREYSPKKKKKKRKEEKEKKSGNLQH